MPNVNDVYPSKWLRAADLRGRSHTVTIADVEIGTVGDGHEEKQQLILHFRGDYKPLGLNKTNAAAIAGVYGDDTDDWIDQAVVIFPTRVDFSGRQVDAIRVDIKATQQAMQAKLKAAKQGSGRKPAPPVTQAEADDIYEDDSIPFEPGMRG